MSGWFDEGTEEPSGSESHADARETESGEAREDDGDDRGGRRGGGGAHERYRVKGDELLAKVKQIVREGNVRKITIRNDADEVLLSFPLAAGVLGAALLPMWAAVGAVAALVGNCSIEVERRE